MSRTPNLAAIVRQNAFASRYLGVDFVPVYRSAKSGLEVISEDAAAASAPEAPSVPKQAEVVSVAERADATAARAAGVPGAAGSPAAHWNEAQIANWELLEVIRKRYEEDAPHQHFVTDHHCIVFGDGDPCARLMFVGEAPGAEEDRIGKPFVGRAGELLNKMITAMGLSREQVYITNVLKTRPPNNATPTLDEARLCAPYLFDQIGVIRPGVIVTLGLPATRLLLGTDQSMGALRGKWATFSHGAVTVPVMPTYHPAFLLRSYTKENREKVWSDLQRAMERLGIERA
ncbi:MAG: uracil-DNA glycosylase [Phycisphaerales bacterium]